MRFELNPLRAHNGTEPLVRSHETFREPPQSSVWGETLVNAHRLSKR
jgi:hypothetical protein